MRDLVKSLAWAIAFTIVYWTSMESLYKGISKSLCKRWTSFSIHEERMRKRKEEIEDSFSRMLFVPPLDVIIVFDRIKTRIVCSIYFKWFTGVLRNIFYSLCENIFSCFYMQKKILYYKINIRQTFLKLYLQNSIIYGTI